VGFEAWRLHYLLRTIPLRVCCRKNLLSHSLGGGLDAGAVSGVLASKASEGAVLVTLADVGEALDGLDSLLGFLDGNLGDDETTLDDLLGTGVLVVGLFKDENSPEVLLGRDAGGTNRDGGGRLDSAVEAADIGGGGAPLVAVELDEVRVVFLGKGPNDAAGGLHI
jgi:hypothetical protein